MPLFSDAVSIVQAGARTMGQGHETGRGIWLILVALVVVLNGCATPAQTQNMIPVDVGVPKAPAESPFREAIGLDRVGGGEEPSPDMTYATVGAKELEDALRTSLRDYEYLSAGEGMRFRLEVILVSLRRRLVGMPENSSCGLPCVGGGRVYTSFMQYKLTRLRDEEVVYDEIIKVSATKTGADEFVGAARDRITLEAAVRGNVARFLRTLSTLGSDGKIVQ
jgi:hypothetical protein